MFGVGYLKALFLEYLESETAACDTRDVQKYVSHELIPSLQSLIEFYYSNHLLYQCRFYPPPHHLC